MGIVFRQSVKTTIVTFTGALLGALGIFLSTHYVPQQELGFIRNLTTQAVVVSQILLLGLHYTLTIFIHRYGEEDKRRAALISISLVIPLAILLLATPFYFIFKNQIADLFKPQDIPFIKRYFACLPVLILLFIYQILFEQYLVSQMKVAIATFMREVVLRVLSLALIILFGLGFIDFDILIYGTILTYLLPNAVLFLIARRTKGFSLTLKWQVFTKEEKKEIVHFSWYHSLLTVSINVMGNLDLIMLPALAPEGLKVVAVYSIAVFIMSFLQIPFRTMVSASFPGLAQAYQNGETDKVKDIFTRSSVNILLASVAMALLICCNLRNAMLFLPKNYEAFVPIVLIMTIGRLADAATGMNDQVLSISKYYKFSFYTSLLLLVLMAVFNYLFIPSYGIYGAAWSSSISLIIYNIAKLVFVWKRLQLQPFTKGSLLIILAGALTGLAAYLIPFMIHPVFDTVVRSTIILVIYSALLLLLKPSPDLNKYLASIKENKRLF